MLRTIDLPELADVDALTYDIDADGILTAQMPLHLPLKPAVEPPPGVVPIVTASNGRRSIRLQFGIGAEFTMDDVKVRPIPAVVLTRPRSQRSSSKSQTPRPRIE